jgi:hypothetical protein
MIPAGKVVTGPVTVIILDKYLQRVELDSSDVEMIDLAIA